MQFCNASSFFTFFSVLFFERPFEVKIFATLGTVAAEYAPAIKLLECETPKEK